MTCRRGVPCGVDDGQMVDVAGDHLEEHLEGRRVDPAGHGIGRQSPGDADAGSTPAASTRVRRSRSVRMPASRSPSMTSRDETLLLRHHASRPRAPWRSSRPPPRPPTRSRTRVLRIAPPWTTAAARRRRPLIRLALWASKKASTSDVLAQPVEVGCGQEQRQGVLDRRDVEGRSGLPGSGWSNPKHEPSRPRSIEGPLRVADLCGTRPKHVEVEVLAASFDQSGTTAEVLDGHPRGKVSSTASGRPSNGSWRARKPRVSESSASRAMPPSWQRRRTAAAGSGGVSRPASRPARRAARHPSTSGASAQVANPRPVPPAAGMRLRAAAGGAREEGGEP